MNLDSTRMITISQNTPTRSLDIHSSLGEIAAAHAGNPAVLNHFMLDYCCGGKKTLAEACAKRGIDPKAVMDALTQTESTPEEAALDYQGMGLNTLADHIVSKHHGYVSTHIPEIVRLSRKIAAVHGDAHPELHGVRDTFQALADELTTHMKKEELILFPYISRLEECAQNQLPMPRTHFGHVQNPIQMMLAEHDHAGHYLTELRTLTQDYTLPESACASYWQTFSLLQAFEADLKLHIHLENNLLFPKATTLYEALQSHQNHPS